MAQLRQRQSSLLLNHAAVAIFAVFVSFISVPQLRAQNPMAGHVMDTRDEIPPEKLPPPEKLSGIGNAHIKITASPEAQMWFDQGLNLLHDFWDYESVRAFVQGTRVDPSCAMCYWGIYHAELFTHSNAKYYAKQALAKAVSLKKQVSEAERLYIEAAEKSEGQKKGNSREVKVYRKLVKKYPADLQARISLAEAVIDGYDDHDQPNPGQKEALAILQGVLKDDPENSAANHYWIHAVEASPHPEQALHSAEILGRLAPASGHMVHMPGHIFYRVGDYAHAQQSFTASTEADEHYMDSQHVPVDDDWNYVHNLMYAIANLMEAGQLEAAAGLSDKLNRAHGELENSLYPWSMRDSISRIAPRLPVALRSADWPTALQLLQSSSVPESLPNIQVLQRELQRLAEAMHALDQHSLSAAETASTAFDAEFQKVSARVKADESRDKKKKKDRSDATPAKVPVMPDAYARPLVKHLSIMSLELRAAILVQKNEIAKAKELFTQASKEEKDLGYHEPPAYVRPVGETEAAAFVSAGDWSDAMAAYKDALVERPLSGFPLYGIASVSEQSGDADAARKQYADFLAAWKTADANLPQLRHAREFVAAHGVSAARK
jgi:tetratricopeptide (TPR) repeat protein